MTRTTRGPGERETRDVSLLGLAGTRLEEELRATRREGADGAEAVIADLRQLVLAVEGIREGRDAALIRQAAGFRVRRPGLLAALRRALLLEAEERFSGDPRRLREALSSLSAIEQLRPPIDVSGWDGVTLLPFLDEPESFQLLREVAHDIRSPLTSILFLAEALRGEVSGPVSPLQRSQLGLIFSAALALQSMVSDVIELSRVGELDDPPAALSLRAVFARLRDLVEPIADEKGLDLRFSLPEGDRFTGQSLLLGRVLLNLTTNALKFTEKGYVEVSARSVARWRLEFSVRDTGRGIAEERQATLFEPFKRSGDSRRFVFSGSGLGLTIARRMLRSMGSDLQYETRPKWGTRFFFELHMPPDRET